MAKTPEPKPPTTTIPETDIDFDDFRHPSSDERGHNARMMFRCQPQLAEQTTIFAVSPKFPYHTQSDLIRHALVRHLRWLHILDSQLGDDQVNADRLHRSEALSAILREEEANTEFNHTIERLQDLVNSLVSQGETRRASQVVYRILGEVDGMGDDHWREKYREALTRRFSVQIDNAPRLSLVKVARQGRKAGSSSS